MMNPLPSVSQASSIVLQEEQQRELRPVSFHSESESSAFLSQQRTQTLHNRPSHGPYNPVQSSRIQPSSVQSYSNHHSLPRRVPQQQSNNNGTVQCNYCKKPGHTIDKCYKLQRQRNDRGLIDRTRRLAASVQHNEISQDSTPTTGHTLTPEQYGQLLSLLSR